MKLFWNKRGHMISEETIKWIIYLAIVIAAGFAIRNIIQKFS
jgi:hypothetical protein